MQETPSKKKNGFWHSLQDAERNALWAVGRPREFATGTLVCRQGAKPDHVLIILEGWVKVMAGRADGHEVMLAIRGPADTVGESGWLNSRPRSANVRALTTVRALAVPADQFERFVNTHPHGAQVLAMAMVNRMDDADRRMTSQVSTRGAQQLAQLLVDLADRYGVRRADGATILSIQLPQKELATWIGISRETVARALADWRRRAIIATGRMRIIINDLPALRDIAESDDDS